MTEDFPFEEIAHMAKEIEGDDLAILLHNSVYPALSKWPKYRSAEEWRRSDDGEEIDRWRDGARRFIAEYEKLLDA